MVISVRDPDRPSPVAIPLGPLPTRIVWTTSFVLGRCARPSHRDRSRPTLPRHRQRPTRAVAHLHRLPHCARGEVDAHHRLVVRVDHPNSPFAEGNLRRPVADEDIGNETIRLRVDHRNRVGGGQDESPAALPTRELDDGNGDTLPLGGEPRRSQSRLCAHASAAKGWQLALPAPVPCRGLRRAPPRVGPRPLQQTSIREAPGRSIRSPVRDRLPAPPRRAVGTGRTP